MPKTERMNPSTKSRNSILESIKAANTKEQELPEIPAFPSYPDTLEQFKSALEKAGSNIWQLENDEELELKINEKFVDAKTIYAAIPKYENMHKLSEDINRPHQLDGLDVAIIKGKLGVAENAAIWVSEAHLPFRALPFIAEHLVIVLDRSAIVNNMHEAYDKISIDNTGFGTFIGGPSKTADIEQVLVVGAQGPLSLTVCLLDK